MLPRQFKLKNSKGEVLDLLNQNGAMFFEPEGLGYTEESDWLRLGTAFRPVNIVSGQRIISGKMIFLGEDKAYADYFNFVRFVRKTPLTIEYTSYDTFEIDVRVQSIDKTELTTYGTLECKIQFACLGPFYKMSSYEYKKPDDPNATSLLITEDGYNISDENSNVLVYGGPQLYETYDYVYSDVYPYEDADSVRTPILDITEDAPVRITIFGPCVKPLWQHYVNDEFVASGKYNGTLADGKALVIDAISMPYRIYETDLLGSVEDDRYGACDFSTERFIFMEEGSNRIVIGHEDTAHVSFKVEVKQCYESV